ncbi:serine/threonine protein kinase [Streptomyces sp. NBC_00704]|uniref:serine/threonine-protein kinase n=1 Tax=Streptomyces sp. NBC_00704 TaxID=2975809 RepID=UPI002E32C5BE|nr:serine/threonine-protein kinase [Streptomyces sp. NBC_00704]
MQGQLLAGRYRLADAIGSGGMGRVWRAHDELLHRAVAIKELTAALYVAEGDQAVLLARTRAEARAAARINHSAVVTVHDVLEHDGRPWIVMELVEGRSLADAVKEDGRVESREAARIGLWVLRALRAAHSAGVLHRDVKPGNVLLSDDGRVLLTDFGIAQIDGDTTITRTGEVVGSVDYLAPERVRGHDPGPSSDLWALGATLYTAVEGRSPFRRTSPLTTLQAVVEEEAADPRHAGPLGPVITALLRKDPAARPTTAAAEHLLAEAAEGRCPDAAQAYVPTQYGGPDRATGGHPAGPPAPAHPASPATPPTSYVPSPPRTPTAAHPLTRPTAVGQVHPGPGPSGPHTPPVPFAPSAADGRSARRRRRLRTTALVVVVAALVGVGTAIALQKWHPGQGQTTGSGPSSPSPSASSTGASGVSDAPGTWEEVHDPLGFGLALPKGWKREVYQDDGDLQQIDYTPDGGEHFVRIALDRSPDFSDPYAHQVDLEQQLRRLVDYERVTLEKNLYRDRDGSEWEYTWTAQAKDTAFPGPRRAIEETYVARDGSEYVVYMSSPAKDWAVTAKQFRSVLQSWREPGS